VATHPGTDAMGMLHFLVSLLPVLGFVPFTYETYTLVADHFLYLPCIGGAWRSRRARTGCSPSCLPDGWSDTRPQRSGC